MHRSFVPLIAASLLLAAAPAAHAEANRSFDFRTPDFVNEGTAHTWGLASFKSARRVVLTGRLNDECPKDGYGAYLTIRVNLSGGGIESNSRFYNVKDVGGCKDKDGVKYEFNLRYDERIMNMSLQLNECDGGPCSGGYGNSKSVTIDNPLA